MATQFYHYLLLSLATLQAIAAVDYIVVDLAPTTPGGIVYAKEIGDDYARETMETITNFIWNMFEETNEEDRSPIDQVTVNIVDFNTSAGVTSASTVNVSATYLAGSRPGESRWGFTCLLYHEMTHVWQWFGGVENKAPGMLIEGIADYTMIRSNHTSWGFAEPGSGDNWDQGYGVTARFLEYCEGLRPGFVAALNRLMKDDYSEDYFNQLLGKPVDDLWREYKAKYSDGGVSEDKTRFRRLGGYRNRKLV